MNGNENGSGSEDGASSSERGGTWEGRGKRVASRQDGRNARCRWALLPFHSKEDFPRRLLPKFDVPGGKGSERPKHLPNRMYVY